MAIQLDLIDWLLGRVVGQSIEALDRKTGGSVQTFK